MRGLFWVDAGVILALVTVKVGLMFEPPTLTETTAVVGLTAPVLSSTLTRKAWKSPVVFVGGFQKIFCAGENRFALPVTPTAVAESLPILSV